MAGEHALMPICGYSLLGVLGNLGTDANGVCETAKVPWRTASINRPSSLAQPTSVQSWGNSLRRCGGSCWTT